jgi:hypothetical protein
MNKAGEERPYVLINLERSGDLAQLLDRQPDEEREVVIFEPIGPHTRQYELYVSTAKGEGRAEEGRKREGQGRNVPFLLER